MELSSCYVLQAELRRARNQEQILLPLPLFFLLKILKSRYFYEFVTMLDTHRSARASALPDALAQQLDFLPVIGGGCLVRQRSPYPIGETRVDYVHIVVHAASFSIV